MSDAVQLIIRGRKIMGIVPEGENVRKAVKWISDKRQYEPEDCGPITAMIEQAAKRFDLSPKDAEFLIRFFSSPEQS